MAAELVVEACETAIKEWVEGREAGHLEHGLWREGVDPGPLHEKAVEDRRGEAEEVRDLVETRVRQSLLGQFVLADFSTSDHLSGRSSRLDAGHGRA